jgi:hypothetical protein
MIWFGKDVGIRLFPQLPGAAPAPGDENARMEQALRAVAQRAPHLSGAALVDALSGTGWVDHDTAARLLPHFRHFDPDRAFAEGLRTLSFRGPSAADEFRSRIARVVEDLTGDARLASVGPESAVRFRQGEREGIVLAYPQVGFTVGGKTLDAVRAAVDEMPDALVIVARNFQEGTREQLRAVLDRTEVPGTLVTVNLLLGIRAVALRYQPSPDRVVDLLGAGRPLRTQDVALLGNRN